MTQSGIEPAIIVLVPQLFLKAVRLK